MNIPIVPIIIIAIVVINVLRRIAEQAKQGQQGTPQQPKQYPTPGERKGGTLRDVIRQMAEQQKAATSPPTQRPKRAEPESDRWFETEDVQEGRTVWDAQQSQIEEFLGVKREPRAPLAPPPIIVEAPTPKVQPRPVPIQQVTAREVVAPPVARPVKPPGRPPRKMERPTPVELPGGVFQNLDDVRRGIIMSEILGPPVGLK